MNEAEAIVRELAAWDDAPPGWPECCPFCDAGPSSQSEDHDSDCLWRRARVLYP